MTQRILLVEDDGLFRRALADILEMDGFRVEEASTAAEGLRRALKARPDLAIVDLGLPDRDGLHLCREIRRDRRVSRLPLLVLTGDDSEGRDAQCLDSGADSYLAKPVKAARLLSYVRSLLRRARPAARPRVGAGPIRVAGMTFEHALKILTRKGRVHRELAPKEFDLLYALALSHPHPQDRLSLYRSVWGAEPPSEASLKTVEVHVRRIRRKLGLKPGRGLVTVSGRGYRLSD